MPSTLLTGFFPTTPQAFAVPVEDEYAATLTGCGMPDGRGLLVWNNGARIRGAITSDPGVWLRTDSVPSTDYFTIASGLSNAPTKTACWEDDGELYIMLSDTVYNGNVTLRTYKCNNPASPDTSGWTAQAVIWTGYAYGSSFGDPSQAQAAMPLVLDSGRWVIVNMVRQAFPPPNENFTLPKSWVGYSDNKGVSWTNTLLVGSGIDDGYDGAYLDYHSSQILQDPNDGAIFWQNNNGAGFVGGHRTFKSTDSGLTWTSGSMSDGGGYLPGHNGITLPSLNFAITSATRSYAYDSAGNWYERNPALPGLYHYNWVRTGTMVKSPAASMFESSRMDPRLIIANGLIYFFNGANKVMAPRGGWTIDFVGIG